jgi:catechol 2,3-dioxygenase-like lactoylglutathione lyase family enzyme
MTQGIHHLGLTVENLEEAKDFFVNLLGWKLIKEDASCPNAFVSDGSILITLWKTQIDQPIAFNRKTNIGLHHLALRVADENELNETYQKIAKSKHKIEFAPEFLKGGPSKHFMVYGPSQIRIELIHYVAK